MSIKRYHLAAPDAVQKMSGMVPRDAGAWVRYDDHAAELSMVRADLELMRVERDEARAQADRLAEAHGKNAQDAAKARRTVGKGHHCVWREVAEAAEQRARAALAALPTAPKLTTVETWAGGELLRVHTEAASPEEDDA